MSTMDLQRIERIRLAIQSCQEPFDVTAIAAQIPPEGKKHEQNVRNGLYWLCENGELERRYIKKGRRKNAVVFVVTPEFGRRRATREEMLAAMARLDAALARWKRAPSMLPASVQMALKEISA